MRQFLPGLTFIVSALLLFLISYLLSTPASADIYRCQQAHQTVFSDSPCGRNAETVTVNPTLTGGRLDTGTDVEFWQAPARKPSKPAPGCSGGYIQSTELRHLRVKQQVREGMTEKQVRYILGAPDHRDGQWWVYRRKGEETGRYRMRGGCLDQWR
ncbi:DUF4124 domain-containing protein [Marinobacter changyiensis]|uniref:DUF4124 domain-containing protein n=1 Tax=Marinobacter changyiensis TaxID=2604091 RepID=UPI00126474C4|nr:DUF4124 domain-containing protein [Marinobacter changyiensis]